MEEAKEIRKLTALEIRQKDFILQEYPMLDEGIVETIIRIGDKGRDAVVEKMKSGELKLEDPMKPEDYVVKSVKVE